ncbi:tonB-system energizer ExbB [Nitrobacter winogradskyi]|uniref:tonB-system energizer ExbB n=2 Tax=Nitrobacter winogradskyi TaxID=913 RepID=UPI00209CDC22|nr:tonB-system energizer ExbB [Nitrobacter winogradskyi]
MMRHSGMTLSRKHHARIARAAIAGVALLIGVSGPIHAQGNPQTTPAITAPHSPSGPSTSEISSTTGSGLNSTSPAPAPAAASSAGLLNPDSSPSHELSPWSMFMSADIVVQLVMIGLAFASLVTWTICIAKLAELSLARRALRAALNKIGDARSLAEAQMALGAREGVLASLLASAMHEARLSAGISSDAGIKERAASSFAEIVRAESRRIRLGMGLLATIGATSPFVGLFGTVWGIMNSFIGISKSQTTNLAVVAPGIAEALLATALGLVAAIPAVIIYNYFARVTRGYTELVGRASGAAGRLLSRDLDRTHGSLTSRAAE